MDLNRRIEVGPRGAMSSRLLALTLLALAVAGAALGIVLPLRALEQSLGEEVAHYRRMLETHAAIAVRRGDLARTAAAANPQAMVELLLAGNTDAAATAALHDRVRELVAATRATLISIQALPSAEAGAQSGQSASPPTAPRRIGLRVQFAADLPGFQRVIHALEGGRPAVVVTNLYLRARTSRAAGDANPLDVQMDLVGFRRSGAG
ncbi:MAG: type II secretion system protein GspM [Rhodospirillales bacterium]